MEIFQMLQTFRQGRDSPARLPTITISTTISTGNPAAEIRRITPDGDAPASAGTAAGFTL
jgi:hypothetical protein